MNATESERLSAGDRVGYLPSLMLMMMRTALRRTSSGVNRPRRPIVTRLDFPCPRIYRT